ncbi:hypothetical protein PAXRUDRAFT_161703 [Paxillus rubicundulus Ve08.2h10]|uniref:Unplaced genomic scaffold scaffold_1503, whole genome shotgun sequence n=1 Tax=Paxillus rubicundulus Ve08.2h10 TaxID=930991 RepID=A0A0D0CUY5_9AGAM|nr:hypothetical protein PAXRUDRAFT_161703 [Paxillus rubicundulus Ve08.2h10]
MTGKDTDYAILQCKAVMPSESCNGEDLSNEQRSSMLPAFHVRMRWNFDGTFIGKLAAHVPPPPSEGVDNHTFLWPVFLATPLLPSGSMYEEVKFSGNLDVRNNHDLLGCAVDAFAHHVVCDSNRTILLSDLQGIIAPDDALTLFDPQAHIEDSGSGHWDKESQQIDKFIRSHKCNKFCNTLDLSFTSET